MKTLRWTVLVALSSCGCHDAETGAEMPEPMMPVPSSSLSAGVAPDDGTPASSGASTVPEEPADNAGQAGSGGADEVAPPDPQPPTGAEPTGDGCVERMTRPRDKQ